MRQALITAVLLFFYTGIGFPAEAQIVGTFVQASPFTGLGDAVTGATAYWSCSRAYSSVTTASKACNICDAANTHCVDVYSDAGTGIVPVPKPDGSTPCDNSGNICTVQTVYNQVSPGNYNFGQSTAASRPTLAISSLGSAVQYIKFVGTSSQHMDGNTGPNLSNNPTTYVFYSQRNGSFTTEGTILSNQTGLTTQQTDYKNATNSLSVVNVISNTVTASDSAWHSIQTIANGASPASFVWVDSTLTTANLSATGTTTKLCMGSLGNGGTTCTATGFYVTAIIGEIAIYDGVAFNATQHDNVNANQAAFY